MIPSKLDTVVHTCQLRQEDPWDFQIASLFYLTQIPTSQEKPSLKKEGWQLLGNDTLIHLWLPHVYTLTHDMHTPNYVFKFKFGLNAATMPRFCTKEPINCLY